MKKEKILKAFYIFLILQPFLDLITSLMTKFLNFPITLGIVVRGLLFLISIIYISFLSKSKYKKISNIYLLILGVFAIIYFLLKPDLMASKKFLFDEVMYMFKYFYTLVILVALLNFFNDFRPNNRKLFKILQVVLCTYCFIIVLANITGTAFGTYAGGKGNTGWFYSGNEIGIVVALLYPILFLLVNKTTTYKCLLYIIPIVLAIEIIGTKTSMLGLLLPTVIFLIYYLFRIRNGKKKQFIITFIILVIIGLSSNELPVVTNIKNSLNRYETRQSIKKGKDKKKTKEVEEFSDGMITSIMLSDRDYYQKNIIKIYNKSTISDKLFGIGFTNRKSIHNKNVEKLIEMDMYDIFYRYGIIGFIIYFAPLIGVFGAVVKMSIHIKFKFNMKQLVLGYMSFIGIGIGFLVGHTLGAPAVAMYLDLAIVMLLYYLKNNNYRILIDSKKVTIMNLHLGTGGIEKYISSLAQMLENDYQVHIVSTYKLDETPAFKFDKKIHITYLIDDYPRKEEFKKSLKDKSIVNIIKYGFSLAKILFLKYYRNVKYVEEDNSKYIITTRDFHNKIVSYNKNRDVIAIATEHNYHNNNQKYVKKLINSCVHMDYLVVVSNTLKEYYQDKLPNTKCIYIPNTIDFILKYQKKSKINHKLISIGRLVEEKGYEDLIDIIAILKKKMPDISLDIYGDGSLRELLENKIKESNLQSNICIKGFYPHDKLFKLIGDYDLYVMSSHTESFGLVLLDAMCNSLPVVAFDSADGAKNLLSDGKGVLIADRNKEKFAEAVYNILNNSNKYNEISKKGYGSISAYYIDNVKKMWLDLLKNK